VSDWEATAGGICIALFLLVLAGLYLIPDRPHRPAPQPVFARVATSNGGSVVGRLLPMQNCPAAVICADPLDYRP